MRSTLPISFLALAAGCSMLWNVANVGPFEHYAEVVGGPELSVARCQMLGTTREGSCELEGSEDAIEAFLDAHGAISSGDRIRRSPCRDRYRFGAEVDAPTRVYSFDADRLPPNQDNVRVQHVMRIDGALCLALEYPYG